MKTVTFGNPDAEIVLVQPVDGHDLDGMDTEIAAITERCGDDFCLVAIRIDDWNTDLSPWKAPAVFGKEDFGGRAEETLRNLLAFCVDPGKRYFIGGYSLAGLFALWAAYQTDVFAGVAAASPSVWFPGFLEYMTERDIRTGAVYLSLGNREEKTRNPVMATVGRRIREAHALVAQQGVDCVLEWNEGNHFKDADLRTAKAFAWILNSGK